jgi:acetyl-CoA acetyltransferase
MRSHQHAAAARDSGRLALEIHPVEIPATRRQPARPFEHDESIRDDTSAEAATELGVEPLARVVASATHALDPHIIGIAPAFAIPKAIQRAGLTPEQIDVWEVHEAYASVALAILRELPNQLDGFRVPDEKLNPNGGAVAIGHPFGSSGTRYVLTLATELRERRARYGVLGVCVGSGQGVALVLENTAR